MSFVHCRNAVIHPFFATLVTQPGLIVEHLDAYADLAKAEAGAWGSSLQSRWILKLAIGVCGLLAITLGAMAALLAGAIDWRSMPHGWVLLAVPAIPIVTALGCWWRLKALAPKQAFALLRDQVATDLKIMRSVDRG